MAILLGCLLISGCKKKHTIDIIEEVTKLSPTETRQPTITNTPTKKPTTEVTVTPIPTPTLSPASLLESEKMSQLSFEVQPVTVIEDFDTPYMTKEEFPVLDGSTANIPLGEAIYCYLTGASIEEAKTDLKFYKTTESYRNLMYGDSDILFVYEPSQTVLQDMMRLYAELDFKPLGRDALVFITNETNPVSSLTKQEIIDIYSGKTTNWSELGGNNQEIMAFQRPETSGSQTLMEKLAVAASQLMNGPMVVRPVEMEGLIDTLASYNNDSNALGYSVYFYANYMYTKPGLKFMEIDGVLPTNETIQRGEYPYVNDFYVVIRKDEPMDSTARILYNYMTTKEAQTILSKAGYVPVVDVEATYPTVQKTVELQGKLKLKTGQYLVDHNVTSEGVYEGDRILAADYSEIVSFPSKYIECGNQKVLDSDVVLLTCYQTVTDGNTRYAYELYSISQKKYLTEHPYKEVYQTTEGFYYFISHNRQLGEWECAYFSPSGKLICKLITKDIEHDFLQIVQDRVVHVKGNTLTYYNQEGTIIKQITIPYSSYQSITNSQIGSNYWYIREDYLWLCVNDYYLIIYDKDGNPMNEDRFMKKLSSKPRAGELWITDSIVGTDGHLYVVGEYGRKLYLLRDDGKILYENNTTYETYHINLYSHLFCIYNESSRVSYYMNLDGEIINPDGKEIPTTTDAIILTREKEFTVYPYYISDVYTIKDNYVRDGDMYHFEGRTNPYLTYYFTTDSSGETKEKSNFLGIRQLHERATVEQVGAYFILDDYSAEYMSYSCELLDSKGKTIFTAKKNESITGLIIGEEIYVTIQAGNYEGIQDLQGRYLYREISSYLSDD